MRRSVIVVASAIALSPTIARAGDPSVHAILDGDVAVTDNVFSVPSGGLGTTPREADVYIQLRPGLLFAYDTPRMIQELTAQIEVLEYVRNYGTPSLTFRSNWNAFYQLTPRTDLGTLVSASTGVSNALTARTSADQTGVTVSPAGSDDIDQVQASERLGNQTTKDTRLSESAIVNYTTTDDHMGDTLSAFQTGATVTFEHLWAATSLGLEAGVTYLDFHSTAAIINPLIPLSEEEVDPHLYAVFRHDFDQHWTMNLNAGVVEMLPTLSGRADQTFPVATALVGYTDAWGRASLQAGRAVTPELFIAQNTVNDSVTATVALPLPWLRGPGQVPSLLGLATIGASRLQLIDPTTGDLDSSIDVLRADLGVTWIVKPGVNIGARYEFVDQSSDAIASSLAPGFVRNTLFFEFALRWPPRVVEVPRRTGMRADGKDLTPIGDELVVPEIAAPAPDGTTDGAPGPDPTP